MTGWRRACGLPETKNDGIWFLGNQIGGGFRIYDLRFTIYELRSGMRTALELELGWPQRATKQKRKARKRESGNAERRCRAC